MTSKYSKLCTRYTNLSCDSPKENEINWVSSSCESLEVCSSLSVMSEVLIKKTFDWWINKLNITEESTGYNKNLNTDKKLCLENRSDRDLFKFIRIK